MTNFVSGSGKTVVVGKETTWGTSALANSGKYYRRTSLDLNLSRSAFTSQEISDSAQTSNMRLGSDTVDGTLEAELSAGSYQDFFAALFRGPWAAASTTTAATIAANSGTKKLIRSAGSWITDGFKVGDSVDISGFTTPATANNQVGVVITALTATDMTLDATLVTKTEGDSVTVAVSGKKLVIPRLIANRTNDSFTVEQWFSDISVSRVSTGVKVSGASINIQPDAMATVSFNLMGKDLTSTGVAYFTTPAAASTSSTLTGSSGALYIGGSKIATVTALSIDITSGDSKGTVIGSRSPADIFLGRIEATGTFSAYFVDDSLFNLFKNETSTTLVFKLDGDNSDSLTIKLPRIKFGGSSVNDTENVGLIQNIPFTALLNDGTDTTKEESTLVLIDTEAV